MEITTIGNIGNYFNYCGCIDVKEEDGKFFWLIENYDGLNWYEIPKELYDALMKHESERKR